MKSTGVELGLTLRCPRGEEWPATSFKSFVDSKVKVQTHETITFLCPAGHEFTLLRAVKSGMLMPDHALKVLAEAERQLPAAREEAKRSLREFKRSLRERKST